MIKSFEKTPGTKNLPPEEAEIGNEEKKIEDAIQRLWPFVEQGKLKTVNEYGDTIVFNLLDEVGDDPEVQSIVDELRDEIADDDIMDRIARGLRQKQENTKAEKSIKEWGEEIGHLSFHEGTKSELQRAVTEGDALSIVSAAKKITRPHGPSDAELVQLSNLIKNEAMAGVLVEITQRQLESENNAEY